MRAGMTEEIAADAAFPEIRVILGIDTVIDSDCEFSSAIRASVFDFV
jgi:hypothetical protein